MDFIYRDFSKLEKNDQSKILKGSIIPRPIAWITSINQVGIINVAPFSYFNVISSSLVSVSIQRKGKIKKDTTNNILFNKEAVINIANIDLIEQLDATSQEVISDISELTLTNLTVTPSKKVSVPGITEAPIKLEAKLVDHVKLYDYTNTFVEADLLILRIIGASINKEVINEEKNYISHTKLKPLARLGGPTFATITPIKYERKY